MDKERPVVDRSNEERVRAGATGHNVRYVLFGSPALVIIIVWLVCPDPQAEIGHRKTEIRKQKSEGFSELGFLASTSRPRRRTSTEDGNRSRNA